VRGPEFFRKTKQAVAKFLLAFEEPYILPPDITELIILPPPHNDMYCVAEAMLHGTVRVNIKVFADWAGIHGFPIHYPHVKMTPVLVTKTQTLAEVRLATFTAIRAR
jgi:hypothetical protein